ncbi:phage holin family protein [Utexia brackfieldae]|uniref:phage holin family protein n=1 Tax=Utexia brackfieldae TaxID=3074108 RepID=UPI00370DDE8B
MTDFKWEEILIYFFITLLGTFANYFYRISKGLSFSILSLTSHLFISSFGGTLTLLICTYFQVDHGLIGAACGISRWSGSKMIEELENRMIEKIKNGQPKQ